MDWRLFFSFSFLFSTLCAAPAFAEDFAPMPSSSPMGADQRDKLDCHPHIYLDTRGLSEVQDSRWVRLSNGFKGTGSFHVSTFKDPAQIQGQKLLIKSSITACPDVYTYECEPPRTWVKSKVRANFYDCINSKEVVDGDKKS